MRRAIVGFAACFAAACASDPDVSSITGDATSDAPTLDGMSDTHVDAGTSPDVDASSDAPSDATTADAASDSTSEGSSDAGADTSAPTVTALASGRFHTCAVRSDGSVACWGDNTYGQLGVATPVKSSKPLVVAGVAGAVAITAGPYHTCALLTGGAVSCWGDDTYGQLGNGTTSGSPTPATISALSGVTAIASGAGDETCAIVAGGAVQCWGNNGSGQLGDGSTTNASTPQPVTGITGATAIAVGGNHACALLGDATMKCWGSDATNQLGDGGSTNQSTPVAVAGLTGVAAIDASAQSTCAALSAGGVKCWGGASYGDLGAGNTTGSATPVSVAGVGAAIVTALGADVNSHCALLADKTVKCWGQNERGELCNGTAAGGIDPNASAVAGLAGVEILASGGAHSCALLTGGAVECWGNDERGELGDGTDNDGSTPVAVTGLSGATALAINDYGFEACAIVAGGAVQCWGSFGTNDTAVGASTIDAVPTAISGLTSVASLAPGVGFLCAALTDGTMKCFGSNYQGQLGLGTTTDATTPTAVTGIANASKASAGAGGGCVVESGGVVACWGAGNLGQIGAGSDPSTPSTPTPVTGVTTATAISCGQATYCALLGDKTVDCWGNDAYGEIGNGAGPGTYDLPTPVIDVANAVSLSSGYFFACAALSDGTVKCWGNDGFGQLGDGTTNSTATPVTVVGVTNAVAVSAGRDAACALLADGTVECWGANLWGQIGDGTMTRANKPPTKVVGVTGATAIAVGYRYACALVAGGAAMCWGQGAAGQLGDGKAAPSTPVTVAW